MYVTRLQRRPEVSKYRKTMSVVKWNADTKHFLTFYKNILGILGLWVLDENLCSRVRWLVSTLLEISTMITLSLEVILHCRDHKDTLDAFLSASSSVTSISKLLLHRVNWRHKLVLVESVIYDWTYVKSSYSRDIMLKYARIGKLGALTFLYLSCASIIFLFSAFLFADLTLPWNHEKEFRNGTSERKLLLAAYCVFGKYTSFTYCLIEVLQSLQVFVNCISHCGNDSFFFGLTMHVCGQFEVLRMDFAKIGCDELFCHTQLGTLLKRHYRLMSLVHHLRQAFNLVILAQILLSVMLLCIEGFQLLLSLATNDTFAPMKHVLFILVLFVQLFIYCFAGQTLEMQTEGLACAIYESPWYTFDLSIMKSLPLIILRTSRPHQLTAGKFLAMNFVSFKEILKTSASYFSVLRVMLET